MFLDTMEDLRKRSDLRAGGYDMVQSAGLVRRLIFDRNKLADRIPRRLHRKESYVIGGGILTAVGTVEDDTVGMIMGLGPWLDAELLREHHFRENEKRESLRKLGINPVPPGYPEEIDVEDVTSKLSRVGRDEFLKTVCVVARYDGDTQRWIRRATVYDVVDLYANHMGGVHWDPSPAHDFLDKVRTVNEWFLRVTMLAIARTVYRALEPRAAAVAVAQRPNLFGLVEPPPGLP